MRCSPPLLAAVLLALVPEGASAGDPWNPRCAAAPIERPVPVPLRTAATRFFPWARGAGALVGGPVVLLALTSRGSVSRDGDARDAEGYYLHRALLAISPAYRGAVTVRGGRLGGRGTRTTLAFSTSGAAHCTVAGAFVHCTPRPLRFAARLHLLPGRAWRVLPTELRIGRTGCFALVASGLGLHEAIPFSVPGPDWGTPGW